MSIAGNENCDIIPRPADRAPREGFSVSTQDSRQGEPLAARMRDGPFKSQEVALAAGKVALREFLELLEFGQENDA